MSETPPCDPNKALRDALQRLAENAPLSEDIQLIQQAFSSGHIVVAQNESFAVGGNATGNIVIIGDNAKFTLSAEA
jgi:hypothetical protein